MINNSCCFSYPAIHSNIALARAAFDYRDHGKILKCSAKVKGYEEGWVHSVQFDKESRVFDPEKATEDAFVACDIPIKAEDCMGYTLNDGTRLLGWYEAISCEGGITNRHWSEYLEKRHK